MPNMIDELVPVPDTSAVFEVTDDAEATKILRELIAALRLRDDDPTYASAPRMVPYGRLSVAPDGTVEKVDRQLIDCLRALLAGHYRLWDAPDPLLADKGKSAWKRNRKRAGWDRLLQVLDSREADGVVTWHLDRLLRQPFDLERLISVADGGGVVVLSYSGSWDLRSGDGRLTARIITAVACKESDDKSRRILRNNEARREKLLWERSDCYGHPGGRERVATNCTPDEPCDDCGAPGLIIERVAIAWAIQAVIDGKSWREIAARFNELGLRTRQDYQWNWHSMAAMIDNPRHAGYLTFGYGSARRIVGIATNGHPIVSRDQWTVFESILRRRNPGRQYGRGDHLLTGLVRCGVCQGRMNVGRSGGDAKRSKNGKPYYVYRCPPDGCGKVSAPAHLLEPAVVQLASQTLADPKHALQATRTSKAIQDKLRELQAVQGRKDDLRELWRAGAFTLAEMTEEGRRLSETIEALEAEVNMMQRNAGVAVDASLIEDTFGPLGTLEEQRRLLRAVGGEDRGFLVAPTTPGRRTMSVQAMCLRVTVAVREESK